MAKRAPSKPLPPTPKSRSPRVHVRAPKDAVAPIGTGDPHLVNLLAGCYRLWAAMPDTVQGIAVFAGAGVPVAAVRRPPSIPANVCQNCGCGPNDRCQRQTEQGIRVCTMAASSSLCSACRARAQEVTDGSNHVEG